MSPHTRDADVIVIGAGAGGLTAAAHLAAAGRRVVVVDRQEVAGGCGTVFTHDGFEFDVGLHYLGGWGAHKPGVRGVLEPLGIDIAFREQDPNGFDTLLFPDLTFAVPKGFDAFRARLHDTFPGERAGIDRYLRTIQAIAGELEASLPTPVGPFGPLAMPWRMRTALLRSRSTLGDLFDRLGLSPRLRSVLDWLHGTYAVPPGQASLVMHAMLTSHYLAGAWYPEGGAQVITDALVERLRADGGELLLGRAVERILVDGGRVRGVRLAGSGNGDGTAGLELRAPVVVSAADLKRTFLELLEPSAVPARVTRRVRGYRMAMPLHVLYLVIDRDLRAEGMANANLAVIDSDDLDGYYAACARGRMPSTANVWITSASLKDPTNPRLCRPGQTNLEVMAVVPASHDFWDIGPGLVPGRGYGARKQALRDQLLVAAERAIPGLGAAIVHEEAATPLTHERHLGASGGTSYGIAATPHQFLMHRPGSVTAIRGLYLAGASARSGHGITGAMIGGVEAAAAVTGAPLSARAPARVPALAR